MLEKDGACRSTDCHIREFVKMATVLIRRHHPHESWLFHRIGDTATNVAIDCAGDILCEGDYPFDEVRCFFARRCPVIARVSDDGLIKTYKDFVEAKLHLTINAKRETEDDWARKIRGGIEQALWKHSRFKSMEHRNRIFHFHRGHSPAGESAYEETVPRDGRSVVEREKINEYTYMGTDVKPVKPDAFAITDDAHEGQPKRNREEDSEMDFLR